MDNYHNLLRKVLTEGSVRDDRTGVGTRALFGEQLKFDLKKYFPAITTKKLAWKALVGELLWFIEGSGDERRLAEITHGTRDGTVTIWTPNAVASYWKPKAKFEGDLGRVYGVQWRDWTKPNGEKVDQLIDLIEGIKNDPYGRRHILTAWNPGELDQMALPPCHMFAQFWVNNGELSCQMYQRSADLFLGVPFNIASYALFTHMIAQVCNLKVADLIMCFGDCHIYHDHEDQVREQLRRPHYPQPHLKLNSEIKEIDHFSMTDIELVGYSSHGTIKAKMAV
jgi:thymidylate synthase